MNESSKVKKEPMSVRVPGTLAMIASLTITFAGFPAQILENYQRGTCEGLSPVLVFSVCITYFLWALYAWRKPDRFLFIAQVPGFLLSLVILGQFLYYGTG